MGVLHQATGTSCEATQYWRTMSNVARLQFVIQTRATCSRLERHGAAQGTCGLSLGRIDLLGKADAAVQLDRPGVS